MNKSNNKSVKVDKNTDQDNLPLGQNLSTVLNMRLPVSLILLGGGLAILLLFIGSIITVVSDSSGTFKAGAVIYNLGVMGLGGILFMGALTNDKLESNIRMGMIISAGLILALGFITSLWSGLI